jgi:hypothetical protein
VKHELPFGFSEPLSTDGEGRVRWT